MNIWSIPRSTVKTKTSLRSIHNQVYFCNIILQTTLPSSSTSFKISFLIDFHWGLSSEFFSTVTNVRITWTTFMVLTYPWPIHCEYKLRQKKWQIIKYLHSRDYVVQCIKTWFCRNCWRLVWTELNGFGGSGKNSRIKHYCLYYGEFNCIVLNVILAWNCLHIDDFVFS